MNSIISPNILTWTKIAFILILFSLSEVVVSKDVNGEIIFSDRIEKVTFKIPMNFGAPSIVDLQSRVVYYDSIGQKHILKPHNAEEVRFSLRNKTYRLESKSYSNGGNLQFQNQFFLHLIEDGFLKLYIFFELRLSFFSPVLSYYLIQKGNGSLRTFSEFNFKKKAVAYFWSCSKLVKKIESRKFRYRHLPELTRYFNLYCPRLFIDSL